MGIGYPTKSFSSFSAHVVGTDGEKDVPLKPIGDGTIFMMPDPGPFRNLLIYGDKLSSSSQLFLLNGSPDLDDRMKFFSAIQATAPK